MNYEQCRKEAKWRRKGNRNDAGNEIPHETVTV